MLLLIASLLTFWSSPTTAQQFFDIPVESVPPNAIEGKEVLLLAHNVPEKFLRLDWFRGQIRRDNNIVSLKSNAENINNGPAQSGREMLCSNGSLLIQNLTIGDTGTYHIQVLTENSDIEYGRGELRVYEPVAPPSIQATHSTVRESAGPVVLTCLTRNTGVSTRWYLNNKDLQPTERRKLSVDKRTLTLQPVSRADWGDYQCEVSNRISSRRSARVRLQVTPRIPKPDPRPGRDPFIKGR